MGNFKIRVQREALKEDPGAILKELVGGKRLKKIPGTILKYLISAKRLRKILGAILKQLVGAKRLRKILEGHFKIHDKRELLLPKNVSDLIR